MDDMSTGSGRPTSRHITVAEAAEIIGVDRSLIIRMVKRGELEPFNKLPGRTGAYLLRRSHVERIANERGAA
jgi:excisionase family DNA binding protein